MSERSNDEHGFPNPVWHVEEGDRESWRSIMVWDNDHIGDELFECGHDDLALANELLHCGADLIRRGHYGGPGQTFTSPAYLQVGKFHTYMLFSGGLDI